MLEFYDPSFFCEEEVLFKIKNNLVSKFYMDHYAASDLALEILEMLTLSDSNLDTLNKYFTA